MIDEYAIRNPKDMEASPWQEREALERLIAGKDESQAYTAQVVRPIADRIIAAGYVTPEAHAAALRKAWEAGRDAGKGICDKRAIQNFATVDKHLTRNPARAALYQFAGEEAMGSAAEIHALTPPAPKGDDR